MRSSLKGDKRFVFSAASQAQRAVDYLHGLQAATEEEQGERAAA